MRRQNFDTAGGEMTGVKRLTHHATENKLKKLAERANNC